MTVSLVKLARSSAIAAVVLGVSFFGGANSASALLVGSTVDNINILGSVGNTITGGNIQSPGLDIPNVLVTNSQEITNQSLSLTFLSSGFAQNFLGNLNINIFENSVFASFSGTAQGVGLDITLSGMDWGTSPAKITSAQVASSAGVVSGVNSILAPLFADDSLTLRFSFLGFQPGTNISQTVNFTTESLAVSEVPIPAALPLFGTGLAVMGFLGWRRKRKIAA